ncbi:unnamed protein product [Sphagnum troendelagicum]|uniref:Uncharacterized protein n=1 Tax=Sphagnum troendelagicum TaxID=128251 RepID=A0ABP0UPE5_9BRYO
MSVIAVTPGQKGESPCSDNRKFTFDLEQELKLQSSTAVDICIHLLKEETRLSRGHFICKSLLPTGTRFQGFALGIDCAFALLWLNVKDNNPQDQSKQNANGEWISSKHHGSYELVLENLAQEAHSQSFHDTARST